MTQLALIDWADILKGSADETICRPLWAYPPGARPAVLTERKRRNLLQSDPEPIGDPEYS